MSTFILKLQSVRMLKHVPTALIALSFLPSQRSAQWSMWLCKFQRKTKEKNKCLSVSWQVTMTVAKRTIINQMLTYSQTGELWCFGGVVHLVPTLLLISWQLEVCQVHYSIFHLSEYWLYNKQQIRVLNTLDQVYYWKRGSLCFSIATVFSIDTKV